MIFGQAKQPVGGEYVTWNSSQDLLRHVGCDYRRIKLSRVPAMPQHLPFQTTTVNPDRINPEFVGIADKFNEHKRNRINSDRRHQDMSSNYAYTIKMHQELDKNLQEKEMELMRLRKIRERHNADMKYKQEENERRERKLEQLKEHTRVKRETLKNNTKQAKEGLMNSRLSNKNEIKGELMSGKMMFETLSSAWQAQKCMRHQSIQLDRKIGNQMINSFYRKKNNEFIQAYRTRIREEDCKSEENNKSIQKMGEHMRSLEKKISRKQKKLKSVLEEINQYSVETPNQRKIQMLTTNCFFRRESSTRSQKSCGSKRSRPSELLMASLTNEATKQSQD